MVYSIFYRKLATRVLGGENLGGGVIKNYATSAEIFRAYGVISFPMYPLGGPPLPVIVV